MGGPKAGLHGRTLELSFAVSSESANFLRKLFNMKIFSINFVIKKVILIFGIR